MRVALYLLFCLALAAIPGSLFPQQPVSPMEVRQFQQEYPTLASFLQPLGLFDVYGSVWFTAIYVLLTVSLIGCMVTRVPQHLKHLRSELTPTTSAMESEGVVLAPVSQGELRTQLRGGRIRSGAGWIAWEKGLIKETANLAFHGSLLGGLLAVAIGSLSSFNGQVLVTEGQTLQNRLGAYDSFRGGRLGVQLPEFSLTLADLSVEFETSGPTIGAAKDFAAKVSFIEGKDSGAATISVNEPLELDSAAVFLVGHGYAPVLEVTDPSGAVIFKDAAIFLPLDSAFTSRGTFKVSELDPQLGLTGLFLPTAESGESVSSFPAPLSPILNLEIWRGNLRLMENPTQNRYALDSTELTQQGKFELSFGQTAKLRDGSVVKFVELKRFATFNIAANSGQNWALGFAALAILALTVMLLMRHRIIWFLFSESGEVRAVALGATAHQDLASVPRQLRRADESNA